MLGARRHTDDGEADKLQEETEAWDSLQVFLPI